MTGSEGEEPFARGGWDAIEAAASAVVPPQQPLHWGTNNFPGRDGIYGLSAYRVSSHWLLVTFGLTELFDKVSADADTSGWGFELTMRVPAEGDQPPAWSLQLLLELGHYVFSGGAGVRAGHRLIPGGPITGTPDTRLTALAIAADPQLSAIDTPNGRVQFLTVVGITADEVAQMQATSTDQVLAELANASPFLVTDVAR
jgi:hypothetical protein